MLRQTVNFVRKLRCGTNVMEKTVTNVPKYTEQQGVQHFHWAGTMNALFVMRTKPYLVEGVVNVLLGHILKRVLVVGIHQFLDLFGVF